MTIKNYTPNPMVITRDNGTERAMDIFSCMMDQRVIFVSGGVDDGMAQAIIAQLLYLDSQSNDDISMYVNSPGGSCTSGCGIIDVMNFIKSDVATYVTGMAASMGSLIATSGQAGKRFMLPHAEHLIHQPMGGLGSGTQQTDFQIHAEHLLQTRSRLAKIYHKTNSKGKSFEEINNSLERDKILTAEESINYGLADHIIHNKK